MALNNVVRIIGGKWRGKKLYFPANSPIRPTLDNIRETLFNWLQTKIVDSYCLDAFSGSGALGIEALSRGAAQVTFIDQDPYSLAHLTQHLQSLNAHNQQTLCLKLPENLAQIKSPAYDIIFLDPPFHSNLLDRMLQALSISMLVKPETLIYFETTADHPLDLSDSWELVRYKKTKTIAYGLLCKNHIPDHMS